MKTNSLKRYAFGLALFCCLALVAELAQAGTGGGGTGGGGGRGGGGGGGTTGGGFGGTGGFGGGSAAGTTSANQQVGTVSWTYDPEGRRIIALTTSNTAARIDQVISAMNQPAPQALIKVVFMEVDHNDGSDIGIEGGYTKNINPDNRAIASAANAFGISGLASAATNINPGTLNTFGQPISGFAPVAPGAGLYTLMASDYQVTLRALATSGKAHVLSRPSILARNNQTASINLGQSVPIPGNVSYIANIGQVSSYTYQSIGIGLQVTPFITADNNVEMIVTPSITSLADRSLWVTTSPGVLSPIFNQRTADTVVIAPDGQTVVIGGLMDNEKSVSESKIPLLGDIPILGAAFRHRTTSNTKTELVIFLTPHVVRRPSDLAKLSAVEQGGTPRAFTEQDLNKFIDKLPSKETGPASGQKDRDSAGYMPVPPASKQSGL